MPAVVVFLLALGVMTAEGVFLGAFGVEGWALHTPLAIAIYLGLERDFVAGGLILASLLLPIEWLVVGVQGVYSLALVLVFFLMCGLRGQIQPGWGIARGIVAALGSVLHSVVLMVTFFLMAETGTRFIAAVGWKMLSSALVVAVVTLLLGKVFARLDGLMDPGRGRNSLEF